MLVCRSLTYAQRAAKALERAGITSILSRLPREYATDGCGYCIKVSENRLPNALVVLKDAELAPGKIYVNRNDGHIHEVFI